MVIRKRRGKLQDEPSSSKLWDEKTSHPPKPDQVVGSRADEVSFGLCRGQLGALESFDSHHREVASNRSSFGIDHCLVSTALEYMHGHLLAAQELFVRYRVSQASFIDILHSVQHHYPISQSFQALPLS